MSNFHWLATVTSLVQRIPESYLPAGHGIRGSFSISSLPPAGIWCRACAGHMRVRAKAATTKARVEAVSVLSSIDDPPTDPDSNQS
jgi:hypothetical protein